MYIRLSSNIHALHTAVKHYTAVSISFRELMKLSVSSASKN